MHLPPLAPVAGVEMEDTDGVDSRPAGKRRMSFSIGIIGFGRIGAEHAQWLAQVPGARVRRVYDPTPARRAMAEQLGLETAQDIRQVLDDPTIDAVLIATPTSMHAPQTLAALAAGKHVLVEKPMALDLPTAQQMAERARAVGKVLSVFHNRRWDLDFLTLRQAIEADIFGRVFNIESRLHQWSSCVGPAAREWRPNWRNEANFGGGGLYDWGSHLIDQMLHLIPARPLRIFAQLRGNVWSEDCDDLARVLIDFDGGCVGLVEINTTTTHPGPRWHVDGARGSASSASDPGFDTRVWAELRFTPAPTAGAGGSGPHLLPLAESAVLGPVAIWKRFVDACRGDGAPAVTMESVLPTMQALDAARESSRTGQAVTLNG